MPVITCAKCRQAFAVEEQVPACCPHCWQRYWRNAPPEDQPDRPYDLSEQDQRFLKAIKVNPEI